MAAQIVSTAIPPHQAAPPVPPAFPMAEPSFVHSFCRATASLDLDDGTLRLLELMMSFDLPDPRADGARKGIIWPSREKLAELLGIAPRTLRKRLASLKAAGIIEDLTAAELRQLRSQGFDVPSDARRGAWRIHYHLLPDLLEEEVGREYSPDRAANTGTIVPPPYTESGHPNRPSQHQESNDPAIVAQKTPAADGGEVTPPIPEPEPEIQTQLREWKVSKPIADRIASQVNLDLINQAIRLLERNQALPRERRVITNPAGWLYYCLMVLDEPQFETWQERITAAEEETIAPAPTTRTVQIPELMPQEPKPVPAKPEPVEDEAPTNIAQTIERSFQEAEAEAAPAHMKGYPCGKKPQDAPVFEVQVETDDQPGTVASIDCGVKQIEHRYDRLPEVPVDDVFIDPERTMPASEPSPEVLDDDPVDNLGEERETSTAQDRDGPAHMKGPEYGKEATRSDERLHIWEDTSSQPDTTDCEKLWRQVLEQLGEEHLPLLDKVVCRWGEGRIVLHVPGKAVAWSLENRRGRIREILHGLTGQLLNVEVRPGRDPSAQSVWPGFEFGSR